MKANLQLSFYIKYTRLLKYTHNFYTFYHYPYALYSTIMFCKNIHKELLSYQKVIKKPCTVGRPIFQAYLKPIFGLWWTLSWSTTCPKIKRNKQAAEFSKNLIRSPCAPQFFGVESPLGHTNLGHTDLDHMKTC